MPHIIAVLYLVTDNNDEGKNVGSRENCPFVIMVLPRTVYCRNRENQIFLVSGKEK